ncbi:MAG TPA: hypothetical protein RMG48_21825 [Myxococcales bacterium LLY-WYZ-16_1]|nr:hypothetical protein [Myxococcales bacterium LLY-WYZ-16_1]
MKPSSSGLAGVDVERAEQTLDEVVIQLNRLLRIGALHRRENEAFRVAVDAFIGALEPALTLVPSVRVHCAAGAVYVNGRFVKVKGASFEAAERLKNTFERLDIDVIELSPALDRENLEDFLQAYHEAWGGHGEPKDLAHQRFSGIALRSSRATEDVEVDRRLELARAYAQLIVLLQEAARALARDQLFSLAWVRRGVQQLVDAAKGQGNLLGGLTLFDSEERGAAEHCAAVTAWSLRMAEEVGLSRREQANLGLAAALHHLAPPSAIAEAHEGETLDSVLAFAPSTSSLEALDRCSLLFEADLPARGRPGWPVPRAAAQCLTVACAYDRLLFPPDGRLGWAPARCLALLGRNPDGNFDPKVLRTFQMVVGKIPVGSRVRLSDGSVAIVLGVGERPPVRLETAGPHAPVIDLAVRTDLEVAELLDPEPSKPSTVPFLLG